ncbi:conjugal transfer protein TraG N-terminal domain-containing protein [Acidovorax sp.]|uniref:conjugal transfer protein TraG N-terminal domain-containing protein n=1 Tax=Acidovorax sp. TaxID=1872122 RepID=UPI0027B95FA9|nr:conjugal transfer protein TraG N-terminal domain-containing protein [Acidovorax sp.]
MSFSVYTLGDTAFVANAFRAVAMFFGQDDYIATMVKAGMVIAILATITVGVLERQFRLDKLLLQFIVVSCILVPKTTVNVESVDGFAAPQLIDDVPIGLAMPISVATTLGYSVGNRISIAMRPAWFSEVEFCDDENRAGATAAQGCSIMRSAMKALYFIVNSNVTRDDMWASNIQRFNRSCTKKPLPESNKLYRSGNVVGEWETFCSEGVNSGYEIIWVGADTFRAESGAYVNSDGSFPLVTCATACENIVGTLRDSPFVLAGCKSGNCEDQLNKNVARLFRASTDFGTTLADKFKSSIVASCVMNGRGSTGALSRGYTNDDDRSIAVCNKFMGLYDKVVAADYTRTTAASVTNLAMVTLIAISPFMLMIATMNVMWMLKALPMYLMYMIFAACPFVVFAIADNYFGSNLENIMKAYAEMLSDPTRSACTGGGLCMFEFSAMTEQIVAAMDTAATMVSAGPFALVAILGGMGASKMFGGAPAPAGGGGSSGPKDGSDAFAKAQVAHGRYSGNAEALHAAHQMIGTGAHQAMMNSALLNQGSMTFGEANKAGRTAGFQNQGGVEGSKTAEVGLKANSSTGSGTEVGVSTTGGKGMVSGTTQSVQATNGTEASLGTSNSARNGARASMDVGADGKLSGALPGGAAGKGGKGPLPVSVGGRLGASAGSELSTDQTRSDRQNAALQHGHGSVQGSTGKYETGGSASTSAFNRSGLDNSAGTSESQRRSSGQTGSDGGSTSTELSGASQYKTPSFTAIAARLPADVLFGGGNTTFGKGTSFAMRESLMGKLRGAGMDANDVMGILARVDQESGKLGALGSALGPINGYAAAISNALGGMMAQGGPEALKGAIGAAAIMNDGAAVKALSAQLQSSQLAMSEEGQRRLGEQQPVAAAGGAAAAQAQERLAAAQVQAPAAYAAEKAKAEGAIAQGKAAAGTLNAAGVEGAYANALATIGAVDPKNASLGAAISKLGDLAKTTVGEARGALKAMGMSDGQIDALGVGAGVLAGGIVGAQAASAIKGAVTATGAAVAAVRSSPAAAAAALEKLGAAAGMGKGRMRGAVADIATHGARSLGSIAASLTEAAANPAVRHALRAAGLAGRMLPGVGWAITGIEVANFVSEQTTGKSLMQHGTAAWNSATGGGSGQTPDPASAPSAPSTVGSTQPLANYGTSQADHGGAAPFAPAAVPAGGQLGSGMTNFGANDGVVPGMAGSVGGGLPGAATVDMGIQGGTAQATASPSFSGGSSSGAPVAPGSSTSKKMDAALRLLDTGGSSSKGSSPIL